MESTLAAPTIFAESLVSSVLILFPQCREVFQRHGGLRCSDAGSGPDEPIAWFANRRGLAPEQLVQELNEAARTRSTPSLHDADRPCRCQSRAAEIFLRYGFATTEVQASVADIVASAPTPSERNECTRCVWDALAQCFDPRYPEYSIVDLGFVESVRCDSRIGVAEVQLVLSSTDPTVTKTIVDQVLELVGCVPPVQDVRISVLGFRPLRPERMKAQVRRHLGLDW